MNRAPHAIELTITRLAGWTHHPQDLEATR